MAVAMAFGFAVVAIGLAVLVSLPLAVLTVLLMAEILWYNTMAKRNALLGPIAMGLCRGISVMLGVVAALIVPGKVSAPPAAAPADSISTAGGMTTFNYHVSAVSVINPHDVHLAPAIVIAVYIAGITVLARNETRSPKIPPMIGKLIRGLLFIQAAFCALAGHAGWAAAIVLLALWPVSGLVGRRFYGS
jgi:hypothetical protein